MFVTDIPHFCHRRYRWCLWRKILPCGDISNFRQKLFILVGKLLILLWVNKFAREERREEKRVCLLASITCNIALLAFGFSICCQWTRHGTTFIFLPHPKIESFLSLSNSGGDQISKISGYPEKIHFQKYIFQKSTFQNTLSKTHFPKIHFPNIHFLKRTIGTERHPRTKMCNESWAKLEMTGKCQKFLNFHAFL